MFAGNASSAPFGTFGEYNSDLTVRSGAPRSAHALWHRNFWDVIQSVARET